jgi:hypothetical protein
MDAEQAQAQLAACLKAFGDDVGMPDLATEENGVCMLVFDGQLHINMMVDPRSGNLLMWATVGSLPSAGAEATLRALMRANLFWQDTDGGTLGLMRDSDAVVFALQRPMAGLDVPLLRALIETTVLRAEQFGAVLGDSGEPAAAPAEDPVHLMRTAIRG